MTARLTIAEVCERLRVTPKTLLRLERDGLLPRLKTARPTELVYKITRLILHKRRCVF